jgi:UDP-MurNAc hydroxylase
MRITGLGHAGMFIETTGGSILCDPVMGRASSARGSRSPTTAASTGSASGKPTSSTSRTATAITSTRRCWNGTCRRTSACCPEYPTDDLEVDLRRLGYDNIVYTPGEVSSTRAA